MLDARHTALNVLNALDQGDLTLDGILDTTLPDTGNLSRRDRALFNALIYGVLRWRGRLDYILSHFSDRSLKQIEPGVLNILRLGLFQILYLDRIPDSATVNTAVELTRRVGVSRAAGFVNALLRNAAANHMSVVFPALKSDPVVFFAVVHSLPAWLARRWLQRYKPDTLLTLCDTINAIPPITIRANTLKTTRQQLLLSLANDVEHVAATPDTPDGITLNKLKRAIPDLPAFKAGWFQVQDAAAQLVSLLLDPQPGESVLDACAGLGGKTAHLAQLMQNKGRIVAIDRDQMKLQQLGMEMQRLGISIVHAYRYNLASPLKPDQQKQFDRILLDAPCSGLGVLRRNPDIKWKSSAADLKRHARVQQQLLDNLAPHVKPDGVLVYAVCSIEPEENEGVIDPFLKNHPEFVIDKNPGRLPETLWPEISAAIGFKTLPIPGNMDGFYFVRLKRVK